VSVCGQLRILPPSSHLLLLAARIPPHSSILSRPDEAKIIPRACRYNEAGNMGRVHKEHHQHRLYSLSRRLTKSIAPAGELLGGDSGLALCTTSQ